MGKIKQVRQSKPRVDLTGKKFTYLTPYEYIKGGKWKCKCDCGNEVIVDTRNLNSGHTQSCGCLQKQKASLNTVDMTGFENDGIKVLSKAKSDEKGYAYWNCICKICGKQFVTAGYHIREGKIKSCGCIHSYNEQKITKILLENNIEFSTQYTFPNLKGINGGILRFDFAIFKNGKLSHLIEYNGLQHYEKPQGKWGLEYETLIENDKRKIEYCKNNNIELRIIKYNQSYDLKDLI